ncbi:MAG TPA: Gfo/Idh/MocA family oxidoreductase [Pirellulales bacterium]|jgi:predicted dehydrogenase|nr:Gfo/Idh/MocA family oxidoreductase [Pirellulales bacterium]
MLEIKFGSYLPPEFHGDPQQAAKLPRVRVALVGTGLWGYEHARAFHANPYTDLVAICGRNRDKVAARAKEFSAQAYTDLGAMLATEKPDLVSLCLGNLDHFRPTMQVLEARIPAFVEKPFVFELDQARTLLAAAEQRKLFFAINFNHRYAEPFLRAKDYIERGALGELVFASWRFGGNHDGPFEHPHCNLIETQCHGIDALLNLCGPISHVSAEMTDKTNKGGFGTVALALRFENAAVGDLLGSYDTSYAYPDTHRCEVNGTRGRLVVEDTSRRLVFNRLDDPVSEVWQATFFDDEARDFSRSHDRHVADMIRCFRSGLPPPIPARQGYEVLRVCQAAIRSFTEGRRIALAEVV